MIFMTWPKYSCRHTFWWCQKELLPIFPVKTEVHSRTESTENFLQKLEMLKAINEKLYSTQSRKDVHCFFWHVLYFPLNIIMELLSNYTFPARKDPFCRF